MIMIGESICHEWVKKENLRQPVCVQCVHYENLPMQYIEIFFSKAKIEKF